MIAEICPIKRFSTLHFQQNPVKIIKKSSHLIFLGNIDFFSTSRKNKPSSKDWNNCTICSIKIGIFLFNIQALLLFAMVLDDNKIPKKMNKKIYL